ncbi:MAG: aldolase/citrate lyase family protein [Vicinamibacterales bacterium]
MRLFLVLSLAGALGLPSFVPAPAQSTGHLNPVIALHEKGLPVFGITHPQIVARGGGRGRRGGAAAAAPATPPPPIDLAAAAKETADYHGADFIYTSGTSDAFLKYLEELTKAGASVRTHPFSAKIGIFHENPEGVTERMVNQLNAGHANVTMEAVESAQEVRDVIKALRFPAAGGTRPETGLEHAAAYWGLSIDEYKKKADVWPLDPNGEILVSAIIESRDGLAHADEIASEPGVAQVFAGYGTLGQVFRGDPDGREAAAMQILAACKKANKPCGFPVNNPAEMEQRMKEGWTVFIMQRRDADGLAAIDTGRKLSGR